MSKTLSRAQQSRETLAELSTTAKTKEELASEQKRVKREKEIRAEKRLIRRKIDLYSKQWHEEIDTAVAKLQSQVTIQFDGGSGEAPATSIAMLEIAYLHLQSEGYAVKPIESYWDAGRRDADGFPDGPSDCRYSLSLEVSWTEEKN